MYLTAQWLVIPVSLSSGGSGLPFLQRPSPAEKHTIGIALSNFLSIIFDYVLNCVTLSLKMTFCQERIFSASRNLKPNGLSCFNQACYIRGIFS
jgi:hypothetical protein